MAGRHDIAALLEVMRRLRDPQTGCPWDRQQDFASIAEHTLEEAYEVLDAIQRQDLEHLRDELGDLLFQVVFHAHLGSEQGAFDFDAVVDGLTRKLIHRHPHVFGNSEIRDEQELHRVWEAGKAQEREAKAAGPISELDGVPLALPALSRAQKLQRRAARVGFDWPSVDGVFDKLDEEIGELREAMQQDSAERVREELGDALFTLVNLARHLKVDSERALREASGRFESRFRRVETLAAEDGRRPADCDTDQLETYWQQAKLESRD